MRPFLALAIASLVVVIGFVVFSAISSPPSRTFVDGWPIDNCRPADDAQYEAFARATLDATNPDHAAVERIHLCTPYFLGDRDERVLFSRSGGGSYVALLHLADGATRGLFLSCGVGIDTERCMHTPDAKLFKADGHVH